MPKTSPFPPFSLEDALRIATTIAEHNAGKPMLRVDIFHELNRAADSGPSRQLVTASSGYGLTKGGYQAEKLELAESGRKIAIHGDKAARVDAVLSVELFRDFFDHYNNSAFPSTVPARSFLAEKGIETQRLDACLEIIRENGRYVGLVQTKSGTERVMSAAAAKSPSGTSDGSASTGTAPEAKPPGKTPKKEERTAGGALTTLPSLNINLQIHLPPDADPKTYDAIFKGIREHLIDAAHTE